MAEILPYILNNPPLNSVILTGHIQRLFDAIIKTTMTMTSH